MGLLSWIRGRRSKPRPPWVRPEFLGLFALLLTATAGVAYWGLSASDGATTTVAAQERREYVGLSVADLGQPMPCEPDCYVEWLWDAWLRDHPGVEIVSKEPVYYGDLVLGYDVVYRTV